MIQEQKRSSIKNALQLVKDANKKIIDRPQTVINYTELRTLKNKKQDKLLAGLSYKTKSFINKKNAKQSTACQFEKQQPKLLTTALFMLKKQHQKHQNIQNDNHSNRFSYSFDSREITPINPLLGGSHHNNSMILKKRQKTHLSNKSRLQSITSQLHQMESQVQSLNNMVPPYKQKDFVLYDRVLGQSEAAYHYAFGKQRKVPQKLIYTWKQCLLHEDKTQIFVPVNPQESSSIPYTHPRIFPLNELQKGFQEVYGAGKHRCLKAGQQALVIQGIAKYLQKCDVEPMKITRKDYDIISDILADAKLTDLQNFPMCYRQIEGHFKIMATRWKYRNLENKTNKFFEPAIINGKNNFLDLSKTGVLCEYLMKNSNKNQYL